MKLFVTMFGCGSMAIGFAASASDPVDENPKEPTSFAATVGPILSDNCAACHQTGAAFEGLNLEPGEAFRHLVGRQSVQVSMLLVEPGAPERSYLVAKLEGSHLRVGGVGARMPLGGALTPEEIETIREWIGEGASP